MDNKYIMSPKDLKTIHFMDEMIEAGVRVFKIEGRARGPEYVRTVVDVYKRQVSECAISVMKRGIKGTPSINSSCAMR